MLSCMPGTHTCHTWHKELPTYTHIICTSTAHGLEFLPPSTNWYHAPIYVMKLCFRARTVVLDLHLDSLWSATPGTDN